MSLDAFGHFDQALSVIGWQTSMFQSMTLLLRWEEMNPRLVFDGRADANRKIALAHGAGAGMDTAFLNAFAEGLAQRGLRIARFEFPYMASYRETGSRRPPDREPVLLQTWHKVIDLLGAEHLLIGGKSLGGRMASMVADQAHVAGLICLGYPFH